MNGGGKEDECGDMEGRIGDKKGEQKGDLGGQKEGGKGGSRGQTKGGRIEEKEGGGRTVKKAKGAEKGREMAGQKSISSFFGKNGRG